MTKNQRNRRRLGKLWRRDRHCHWCGVETVIIARNGGAAPPNAATLDHVRSHYDLKRQDPSRSLNPLECNVLACWKCNNDRARDEQARISKLELEVRSAMIEEGWKQKPPPELMPCLGGPLNGAQMRKSPDKRWLVVAMPSKRPSAKTQQYVYERSDSAWVFSPQLTAAAAARSTTTPPLSVAIAPPAS